MPQSPVEEFPEWVHQAVERATQGTFVKPLHGEIIGDYEIIFAMIACAHVRMIPSSTINIDVFCGQVPALERLAHNAALAISLWISKRTA